jgi:hypothetical protein
MLRMMGDLPFSTSFLATLRSTKTGAPCSVPNKNLVACVEGKKCKGKGLVKKDEHRRNERREEGRKEGRKEETKYVRLHLTCIQDK